MFRRRAAQPSVYSQSCAEHLKSVKRVNLRHVLFYHKKRVRASALFHIFQSSNSSSSSLTSWIMALESTSNLNSPFSFIWRISSPQQPSRRVYGKLTSTQDALTIDWAPNQQKHWAFHLSDRNIKFKGKLVNNSNFHKASLVCCAKQFK